VSDLFGIALPDVFGDPAGLRELARQLRGRSTDLGSLEHDLLGTARGLTFEGPAGDDFRGRVDGLGSALAAGANELTGLAARVDAAADTIEAEQKALAKALEERREASAATGSGG
jgi:hypothetical protein